MMNATLLPTIDTKFSSYEALRTTPFPYIDPIYNSTITFGARTSPPPNGNRESICGDNENKESLISEEEVQKFNRNSIATEYLSDDAIHKAQERARCASLGAIGSEMGYGCMRGRSHEFRAVEEGEVNIALDSCGTDNDPAERGQTDDNQDNDEYKTKVPTGPGKMRVESNGAAGSYSGDRKQRHGENSYKMCETFQHRPDQGKERRNDIPRTENFQTVNDDQSLRNLDSGGETRIAITGHEFFYNLDFRNFLIWYYNSMRRDFQGNFISLTATSGPESCEEMRSDILPSQPMIRTPIQYSGRSRMSVKGI